MQFNFMPGITFSSIMSDACCEPSELEDRYVLIFMISPAEITKQIK